MQKIFRAMQKYGLIVADNGSDMYITGTFDTRWNNDILNPAFSLLRASDFEVVQLGWKPSVAPSAALASIAAKPSAVVGGNAATGSVTLTAAAAAPLSVALRSASGAVSVPATVTVAAGATTATFGITTSPVSIQTVTSLTATYNGVDKTTTFTVNPAVSAPVTLATLTLAQASVVGGTPVSATVTLSAPAPGTGTVVTLTSKNPGRGERPVDDHRARRSDCEDVHDQHQRDAPERVDDDHRFLRERDAESRADGLAELGRACIAGSRSFANSTKAFTIFEWIRSFG